MASEKLDIKAIYEAREAELQARQASTLNRWSKYITLLESVYKAQGKTIAPYQKANIAQYACSAA